MARKRLATDDNTYNWPTDWQKRRDLRNKLGSELRAYITRAGDGQIRLDDILETCLVTDTFTLRLNPEVPSYRLDADEKSLRLFVAEQLRRALVDCARGKSILDQRAEDRRGVYVWVPDAPAQQLSHGFYRLLGALDEDELRRFYQRNKQLRVAYEAREMAGQIEAEARGVIVDDTFAVDAQITDEVEA